VTVRVTDAVLRSAAARAGGVLTHLDVSGCAALSVDALVSVLAANAATLRTLRAGGLDPRHGVDACLSHADVAVLREAAPNLQLFEAGVRSTVARAAAALRGEPPFGPPLRVSHLALYNSLADERELAIQQVLALGAFLRGGVMQGGP
jgi:hypothetical protein